MKKEEVLKSIIESIDLLKKRFFSGKKSEAYLQYFTSLNEIKRHIPRDYLDSRVFSDIYKNNYIYIIVKRDNLILYSTCIFLYDKPLMNKYYFWFYQDRTKILFKKTINDFLSDQDLVLTVGFTRLNNEKVYSNVIKFSGNIIDNLLYNVKKTIFIEAHGSIPLSKDTVSNNFLLPEYLRGNFKNCLLGKTRQESLVTEKYCIRRKFSILENWYSYTNLGKVFIKYP